MSADIVNIISILRKEKNITDVSFNDQCFIGCVLNSGIYGRKEQSVLLLSLDEIFIHRRLSTSTALLDQYFSGSKMDNYFSDFQFSNF